MVVMLMILLGVMFRFIIISIVLITIWTLVEKRIKKERFKHEIAMSKIAERRWRSLERAS